MLSKRYKTIYLEEVRKVENEEGIEVEETVQIPSKTLAYYKDDVEITEEEYNRIIASLPKPKEPTEEELRDYQETLELIKSKKELLNKYKEDVEQVELFGMYRSDYNSKKIECANLIIELRELEKKLNNIL